MRCGVDEAGRGPLAGPVVAAAVVLTAPIAGLADSKKLSARRRAALVPLIREHALWAVAWASAAEIDVLNIHRATLLAMQRAVAALGVVPDECLVDGRFVPELPCPARAEVGGDARFPQISAASILAKEWRDAEMRRWDRVYPDYDFARHKGYPTAAHLDALQRVGPSPIHRYSYAPVAQHSLDL